MRLNRYYEYKYYPTRVVQRGKFLSRKVRLILRRSPIEKQYEGAALIHYTHDDKFATLLVILQGGDVNGSAEDDWTPLRNSISWNNMLLVLMMLSAGAHVITCDKNKGKGAIYQACNNNHLHILKMLLDYTNLSMAECFPNLPIIDLEHYKWKQSKI